MAAYLCRVAFAAGLFFLSGLLVASWAAQPVDISGGAAAPALTVGIKEAPPFAYKDESGAWRGISVELWKEISLELNLTYEFVEFDLAALIDQTAQGKLDAAIGALTITPERESRLDFTHPFYNTGLGIAVAAKPSNPWLSVIKAFLSPAFLQVIGALALTILIIGTLIWWFERKRNSQFGGGAVQGIGSGFWWSAVTMTTVGYGDKAPMTLAGRIIAVIWMFAGIILISSFTAAIAASLTVTQLDSVVHGPEDLPSVSVVSIAGSTSANYLEQRNIGYVAAPSILEGLRQLQEGRAQALVYDEPLLRFYIKRDFSGSLQVLERIFDRQDYGIALPNGSPLREPLNRVLLMTIQKPSWEEYLQRYLGR